MKIGIGITTHNRLEVFNKTFHQITTLNNDAKIVVVDDASETPNPQATYRFEENVGLSKAKNKCLELLDDCDYIFLFDDDCFPVFKYWESIYIKASQKTKNNHFSFIFDKLSTGHSNNNNIIDNIVVNWIPLKTHINACGCMLFFTKKCLEIVGGFDTGFNKYGWEHIEYSNRIYNAGLTMSPFIDIQGSLNLFYSYDYYRAINSTMPMDPQLFKENRDYYISRKNDCNFKKYK